MEKTKDDIILDLIKIVKSKKEKIENNKKLEWKTNCVIQLDGKTTNLKTISAIEQVVSGLSGLVTAKNAHSEACLALGIISMEYKYNGFTFDDWTNDFKNVVNNINMKNTIKELEIDEAKLDKLVSKEKREALELSLMMEKYK